MKRKIKIGSRVIVNVPADECDSAWSFEGEVQSIETDSDDFPGETLVNVQEDSGIHGDYPITWCQLVIPRVSN
jgi:hypothetical protein